MGYRGDTFRIGLERGGLVGNKNLDALEPTDMVSGTKNINLHNQTREKRGGSAHVNTATYATAPQVMGVHDFRLRSATRYVMAALKDGKIYKDNANTIKTGMSTTNFFKFTTFLNTLYICDGGTTPQSWDGTAGTSVSLPGTDMPTDWTGVNYPQGFIVHGVGNTERLWAFGCPSTPHRIYAAKDSTANFNDADATIIDIETEDGFGIVGGVEFGDRLVCFGKTKAFTIDDSDSTIANWGYKGAQWYGGAAHWRVICKTPNDLIAMMEDGEIYSVGAAETYGDYRSASLLRPADMHRWFRENADLSDINKFHMVYDRTLRAVRVFYVNANETNVSKCLLYYIDRPPREAWMLHDNEYNSSGFDASCAAEFRDSAGVWKIYTGDYSGNLWKLEEANQNDNSNKFYGGFTTPPMHMGNERINKKFRRGIMAMQAQGDYELSVSHVIDGENGSVDLLLMDGAGGVLDDFELDVDKLGGPQLIDRDFDIGDTGKRIQLQVYNDTLDETFDTHTILIDHKNLGAKPI